jgi:uncharacterized repeat protein (TIGR03803 family)
LFEPQGEEDKLMHIKERFHNTIFGPSWSPLNAALAIMLALLFFILLLVLMNLTAQPAQGQTYKVIYNFTGGQDGALPFAGLTPDGRGNFYGTTAIGGRWGEGNVFKLVHQGTDWAFSQVYSFQGGNDGAVPYAGVIPGADGVLYGTNSQGGGTCGGGGCGTVFSLRPPATACKTAPCEWAETVLHRFDGADGASPLLGNLVFDDAGNLYGTTQAGGHSGCGNGCGLVYQLTLSSGGWTENVLYGFTGADDGGTPWGGVIFDKAGKLYGTTSLGGTGGGVVFQLADSGYGWTEKVLYDFARSDGYSPIGGLILDQSGVLYGTTSIGGRDSGGTVFMLSPSNGHWTFNLLYSFSLTQNYGTSPGPYGSLVMDTAGNLYGTTFSDGLYGHGNVFKLTPANGS